MSALEIYFLLQADKLINALEWMGWIGIVITCIAIFLFSICCTENQIEEQSTKDKIIKYLKVLSASFMFMLLSSAIIPNTKTLAAMKMIPAALNNEDLQEIFGDSLDILKLKVKEIKGDLEK